MSIAHTLEKLAADVAALESSEREARATAAKAIKAKDALVDPLVAKVAALQQELALAEANRRAAVEARGMAQADLEVLDAVLDDAEALLHKNKVRFDKDAARVEKAASMAKVQKAEPVTA